MDDEKKMGRPTGSLNKLTKEARAMAKESGLFLPHEILLRIANGKAIKREVVDGLQRIHVSWVHFDDKSMLDAAKSAAPYYAPKIATVEVIQGVSDEELDAIIAGAAAEAGVSFGVNGEGEAGEDEQGEDASPAPRSRKRFSIE